MVSEQARDEWRARAVAAEVALHDEHRRCDSMAGLLVEWLTGPVSDRQQDSQLASRTRAVLTEWREASERGAAEVAWRRKPIAHEWCVVAKHDFEMAMWTADEMVGQGWACGPSYYDYRGRTCYSLSRPIEPTEGSERGDA